MKGKAAPGAEAVRRTAAQKPHKPQKTRGGAGIRKGDERVKGILLAAGKGTRLYPMTKPVCKPLLPVYDKPLIYYPLAILMQAGITDILVIVPPGEEAAFSALLGNGKQWGLNIYYTVQTKPRGIADALLIGESFAGNDQVCLVLGDNIFHAVTLERTLKKAAGQTSGATVFGYWVENPSPFGVVEFDENGRAISIEEKPRHPKSNYIVPGLYFYDQQAMEIARGLKPSDRGELEITDVNLAYLRRGQLQVIPLEKGFTWLDAGTADSLLDAAQTIKELQERTGRYIGCLEEHALAEGWISREQVHEMGRESLPGASLCKPDRRAVGDHFRRPLHNRRGAEADVNHGVGAEFAGLVDHALCRNLPRLREHFRIAHDFPADKRFHARHEIAAEILALHGGTLHNAERFRDFPPRHVINIQQQHDGSLLSVPRHTHKLYHWAGQFPRSSKHRCGSRPILPAGTVPAHLPEADKRG